MKDYFEVLTIVGPTADEIVWYRGNNFTEAVKEIDTVRQLITRDLPLVFVYNEKEIILN